MTPLISLTRPIAAPALFVAILGLLVVFSSCADAAKPSAADKPLPRASKTITLKRVDGGTIERLHTFGGDFLASQPKEADFRHAAENGTKAVVNLCPPNYHDGLDERALVTALGMEYHSHPFEKAGELPHKLVDKVRALLNDPTLRPIMVHGDSGDRVGAIWLVHRYIDGGLSWKDAEIEARAVGMTHPAYLEAAKAYVARHESKKAAKVSAPEPQLKE